MRISIAITVACVISAGHHLVAEQACSSRPLSTVHEAAFVPAPLPSSELRSAMSGIGAAGQSELELQRRCLVWESNVMPRAQFSVTQHSEIRLGTTAGFVEASVTTLWQLLAGGGKTSPEFGLLGGPGGSARPFAVLGTVSGSQ